jgi:ATP-binding cassette subfamily C (CFTR/MRP) protein 4
VDLKLWSHGDQTLVSNDGSNLSGGQKSRINLARAVYKEAKLYLLDDIFSALDPEVSRLVFQKCIREFLKNKTVILVTHNQNFLNSVDFVINMESGNIEIEMIDKSSRNDESDGSEISIESTVQKYSSKQELNKETTNYGSVGFSVYFRYFSAVENIPFVCMVLIMQVLSQFTISAIDIFLAEWMNWEGHVSDVLRNSSSLNFTESANLEFQEERQIKLEIFAIAVVFLVVIVTSSDISFFYLCLRAAKNLYFKLYNGVTNTFLSFFNNNPSGRILNRFSKDIGNVDYLLPETFYDSLKVRLIWEV